MNYCLFASKQGLLFESHALFEGVNIIGMGVNIVRIRILRITDKQFGAMELFNSQKSESLPEEGVQLELF